MGRCDREGISGRKAWKEDLSVPNDGVDIKFQTWREGKIGSLPDLGSWHALM